MRSTAAAICLRMARVRQVAPSPSAPCSRCGSARRAGCWRGWCEIEPSWPVFIACSMSKASAPRDLAEDDAVGAHAQRVPDQVALRDLARPSRLGGRVSSRTTCGCCSCSSAASSMVTMRSPWSIRRDSALSMVVLPEPVPPETMMFSRQRAAISSMRATGWRHRAVLDHRVEVVAAAWRICGSRCRGRRARAAGRRC